MNSYLTEDFISLFRQLPESIRQQARKNYRLWRENPRHPSLHFKRIHASEPIWSARVGIGWRVVGLIEGDSIYWFWIGSHADYDKLIAGL